MHTLGRPLTIWLAAVLGGGLIWLITQQPLAREEEPIIPIQATTSPFILQPGESREQSFTSSGGRMVGFTLASPDRQAMAGHLSLTLYDNQSRVLGRALGGRERYDEHTTTLLYEMPIVSTQPEQIVTLKVTNLGRGPLSLLTNKKGDLAVSARRPAALSRGATQGVLAGLALLFGSALLAVIEQGAWRKYQWMMAALLLIILISTAMAGYWFSAGAWGISDWDYYSSTYEYYRQTLVQYHQLPLWNPYTCGGTAGLGDAEFALFSFILPPLLLFGVPTGFKVALYICAVMAALGMLALSRRLKLSAPASYLAAIILPLSTTVGLKFVEGHIEHLAVAWIPWILWSWLGRRRLLCGFFLALAFYQGGIYMLFYLIPGLLLMSLLTARPKQALMVTIQAGLWSFGFSALKLFPVLLWIKAFPDDVYHTSANFLPHLQEIFLGRHLHGAYALPHQEGGWHEYGAFIGFTVLGLALIGASQWRNQRHIRVLVVGLVAVILFASSGPFLRPLFDVLTFLPRSNVSRSLFYAVVAAALLAGAGYDVLRRRLRTSWSVGLLPLVIGLVAVELASLAYPLSLQAFILPPLSPSLPQLDGPPMFSTDNFRYRIHGEEYTRALALAHAGYGTLNYCSVLGPPSAVRLEQPIPDGQSVRWSPNEVTINVNAPGPATIQINTNYAPGWRVTSAGTGRPATNQAGLVGTTIGPGRHQLTFRYHPPGLASGVAVTGITTLAAGYALFFKKGRARMLMRRFYY